MQIKFKCTVCGKEREVRKQNRKSKFLYCSLVCYGKSKIKYKTEEQRLNAIRVSKRKWKKRNPENTRKHRQNRWKKYALLKGLKHNKSQDEQKFYKQLRKEYPREKILRNTRDIIKNPHTNYPLELDLYIPKYKLAFEINGICHRKPVRGGIIKLKERQRNDKIKKVECKRLGIKLKIINV